jgi:hypothetical protein
MWLLHDGAPPSFGKEVTELFNEVCEGRWIGRGGPMAWPSRSPDLRPFDFFLWGCMKLTAHHGGEPEARHQLVEAIVEAPSGIRDKLGRMPWQDSMAQRLAACMHSNGGHFEHALY